MTGGNLNSQISRTPPYQDTEVSYARTKGEVELLLKSYGAKGVQWTSVEGRDDTLEFAFEVNLKGVKKIIGIRVSPPHIYIKKKIAGRGIVNTENPNQEYRLLFYWIKSKMEAVTWGLSTIEREFLSQITASLPDGSRVSVGDMVTSAIVTDHGLESLPFFDREPPRKTPPKGTIIDV